DRAPRIRSARVSDRESRAGDLEGRAAGSRLAAHGPDRERADPLRDEGAAGRRRRLSASGGDQDRARSRLSFRRAARAGRLTFARRALRAAPKVPKPVTEKSANGRIGVRTGAVEAPILLPTPGAAACSGPARREVWRTE